MALFACFFVNDNIFVELPFKPKNPATFLDSTTHVS